MQLHKATGQAYAVLNGRYIFFGLYGSDEATKEYHKTIAEWLANGRMPGQSPTEITIQELVARYWVFAEKYYADATGKPISELGNILTALRMLCDVYGHTPAVEFGPRGPKTIREAMIKKDWCRGYINQSTNRLKRMFKWATAEEIIPGLVSQALWAVSGLKKGRCEAKEPDPVRPVPQEHIDAIQPYVSRQIWAMIQMQLLIAARPGEILKMRPCDIDRTGNLPILHCWQTIGCNNQAGTLL